MLKFKTTRKELYNYYGKEQVLAVGYCELQTLLQATNPNAYTSDAYGWASNVYLIGNVALCTGYRPYGQWIEKELVTRYEKAAQNVWACKGLTFDQKKDTSTKMLEMFVNQAYKKGGTK